MKLRHALDPVDVGKWNGNIHYHDVVLDELPANRRTALDIGCGEGILTRQLAPKFTEVIGIDPDIPSIELAKELTTADNVRYTVGDFMEIELEPDHFDLITSVVALHHMDVETALERMKRLTRPGGRIVLVGIAAESYPVDVPRLGVAFVVNNFHRLRGRRYAHSAPVLWPQHTSAEMKALVERVLPGARFVNRWLFRYTIVWQRP